MRRVIGIEDDPTNTPDFDSNIPEHRKLVDVTLERVRKIMLTRTMDEWIEAFEAEGAPCSKVNFPEEMADDPQVEAMGYMLDMEHELTGPGAPRRSDREDVEDADGLRPLTSPPLGKHTDEILHEHGVDR